MISTPEMIEAAMSKLHKGAAITEAEMGNALTAALAMLPSEPIGEAGPMPGSNGGFTMAAFKATDVPVGTKLYTSPTPHPSLDREGLLEEAREVLSKIAYITELKPPKGHWRDAVRESVYDKASAFLSKLEGSSK